ncbi:MAG: zinc-ribbon domain-containing protein [Alphaproteobacteria bacterium]|nr:zinc-ribbon domain-containing protein [Alphaproteobacteria bacterium]
MILVCNACNARYLVPATVFSNGPKHVRCARCSNTWLARLPPDPPAVSAPVVAPAAPVKPLPPVVETPVSVAPIPKGSGLPTLWKEPVWHRRIQIATIAFGLVLTVALLWLLLDRNNIAKHVPSMERVYYAIGLPIPHPGDGLVLKNVHSERKFEDGHMQLVVVGEIYNESSSSRIVPELLAVAIGPDGSEIQRWQIKVPADKLTQSASAPFRSAIMSPSGLVVEVKLTFIETEDKKDVDGQ